MWDECEHMGRSQWTRGLRRESAAAPLRGLRVRSQPGAWIWVFCECCVLSGRGLSFGLITRPEEAYREWCVEWVCWRSYVRGGQAPKSGRRATGKKLCILIIGSTYRSVYLQYRPRSMTLCSNKAENV